MLNCNKNKTASHAKFPADDGSIRIKTKAKKENINTNEAKCIQLATMQRNVHPHMKPLEPRRSKSALRPF